MINVQTAKMSSCEISKCVTILSIPFPKGMIRISFASNLLTNSLTRLLSLRMQTTMFVSTSSTWSTHGISKSFFSIFLAPLWSSFNRNTLFFKAYSPPAAINPACRIPPPNTFLTRRAFSIKSASPIKRLPIGAPRPFERQTEIESNC